MELPPAKVDVIRQLPESGTLGELTTVLAEYGEYFEPGHRIFYPALAGGPLLDLGTYPLSLITTLLGEPEQIMALGQPRRSRVNAELSFAGGRRAVTNTNLHNFTPTTATLVRTAATLTLDGLFNMPGGFSSRFPDGRELRYDEPAGPTLRTCTMRRWRWPAPSTLARRAQASGRSPIPSGPCGWPTRSGVSWE